MAHQLQGAGNGAGRAASLPTALYDYSPFGAGRAATEQSHAPDIMNDLDNEAAVAGPGNAPGNVDNATAAAAHDNAPGNMDNATAVAAPDNAPGHVGRVAADAYHNDDNDDDDVMILSQGPTPHKRVLMTFGSAERPYDVDGYQAPPAYNMQRRRAAARAKTPDMEDGEDDDEDDADMQKAKQDNLVATCLDDLSRRLAHPNQSVAFKRRFKRQVTNMVKTAKDESFHEANPF